MNCDQYKISEGFLDEELIHEIDELASQLDPIDPKFVCKQQQIRRILDMMTAKFSSLQLYYACEIFECKEQIRNRNQHIQQLELALQELMEKYRQQKENEGQILFFILIN